MKYATRLLSQITQALVIVLIPTVAQALVWNVTPSIETTLVIADNISGQAKGNEEDEIVFGVKPAVRLQGGAEKTQLRLAYGIDNLYYTQAPSKNSSRQELRSNGSAELLTDLFFIEATGSTSYQPITPTNSLGTLGLSGGSTQVDTWSVYPYFQQTMSRALTLRAGVGLGIVEYHQSLLPNSFAREYFFSALSGPASKDVLWMFDVKTNDTFYDEKTSDSSNESVASDFDSSRKSAELDLKYKVLPAWALTGRIGYIDYQYNYDPNLSREPKGKVWRAGGAWLPSLRTVLELGLSEHFFGSSKYGVFTYQGRWLHWNTYYEEVVTSRRELQINYSQEQTKDPTSQASTPITPHLTETEKVFLNKVARLTGGYKSDELSVEVLGYRDRRIFLATVGREVVTGGKVTVELFLSQRASLSTYISQANITSSIPTRTKLTDFSASLQRKFGKGMTASINVSRNTHESNAPAFTNSIANFISTRLQMEF